MAEDNLSKKLAAVPTYPGVYLWKNSEGRVIYVGKAKVLRSRVRSYFQRVEDKDYKTRVLVSRIRDLEWIVTDSEKEALILEATLIKKHKPRYNVRLRDDKRFLCLKLSISHQFPRLYVVRRIRRDGDLYFGPFDNARAARETLRFLNGAFPLRKCSNQQFSARARPCLQHQIGRCRAPCVGYIKTAQYAEIVQQVKSFFAGRLREVLPQLQQEMEAKAEEFAYEEAAQIRDRISAIEKTLERQKAVTPSLENIDVFGMYREGSALVVCLVFVRGGYITGQRTFPLRGMEEDNQVILSQLLGQYYKQNAFIPAKILLPVEPEHGLEILADWLRDLSGKKVTLRVPQKGDAKKLVEMAKTNAKQQFALRRSKLISKLDTLGDLQQKLHLPRLPETIECFDISNVSGKLAVASKVSFEQAEPDKSRYRRYRIRIKDEPDDYAMMREALTRRISRGKKENDMPDLILVDGGKGHLGVAMQVLQEHGLNTQPVAAIAKIKNVTAGDTEGGDKIYLPGRKNAVTFKKHSNTLLLLQRIRDESHRFALAYHKSLRNQKITASVLDDVPGLGKTKCNALLRTFGSVKAIRKASAQELTAAPGIGPKLAQVIYQYLSGQ